jgi:hypothetical protein
LPVPASPYLFSSSSSFDTPQSPLGARVLNVVVPDLKMLLDLLSKPMALTAVA